MLTNQFGKYDIAQSSVLSGFFRFLARETNLRSFHYAPAPYSRPFRNRGSPQPRREPTNMNQFFEDLADKFASDEHNTRVGYAVGASSLGNESVEEDEDEEEALEVYYGE